MKNLVGYILVLTLFATMSCHSVRDSENSSQSAPVIVTKSEATTGSSVNYLPKAVIYKTNGDFNDNVLVNMDDARKAILSYPAISDVSSNSAPIVLKDGWLLDRRGGVNPNSAFLNYTYQQYSSLKKQPTAQALMKEVIPNAKVTEVKVLPITYNEALSNPESVNKYIP